jgi:exo-beta-1,3-glucanase (GH17 family)
MRFAFGFFLPVAAAIVAFWWWLGLPVAMPLSPLAPGEKLPCVSYTPFRNLTAFGEATPAATAAQIETDLALLAPVTSCVRTYSIDLGVDQVPEIARRHGLTVLLGVWIGREPDKNRLEVDRAVALANRHADVVRAVIVGNEVLLRGELSPETLTGLIRDVKARVPMPVTYADVWEFWLRYHALADAVDFLTVHILPYWEDIPIAAENAGSHMERVRRTVAERFPGKDILIGEVGWPGMGRMREGALPSAANEARVLHDVIAAGKRGGYRVNVIEAFDQPWKRQSEGTVGGYWGLFPAEGSAPKFTWGQEVSNFPFWRAQAAGGVAFAAVIFALALAASRRNPAPLGAAAWAGAGAIALGAGALIGWTARNVPLESLGLSGWAMSLILAALAIAAPLAGAAAVTRGIAAPPFAALLGAEPWPESRLARALGAMALVLCVVAIALALGLVFDPRYRDFPFAPLTAAVVPYLVLMLLRPGARRGLSEIAAAAVLALSALFIVWNEGIANWQALWLCAVFLALAVTLSAPGARRQGS